MGCPVAKVLAVTNQKGGVGKTTTALNLGAGLGRKGARVLFIDMDPQCSLSYILGAESGSGTIQDLLMKTASADQVIQHVEEGDLIPASPGLSSMDMVLNQTGKEYRLREGLAPILDRYDYIIIDSPPTLGVLTINILTAAQGILIPVLADIFSLQGVGQLVTTIQAVQTYCNPGLRIRGLVLTRHTDRYVLSREMRRMLQETAEQLGTKVYEASIREAVGVREAQARRMSIFRYDKKSKQAMDYEALVDEFLRDEQEMKGF